jgi:hypothetical protein
LDFRQLALFLPFVCAAPCNRWAFTCWLCSPNSYDKLAFIEFSAVGFVLNARHLVIVRFSPAGFVLPIPATSFVVIEFSAIGFVLAAWMRGTLKSLGFHLLALFSRFRPPVAMPCDRHGCSHAMEAPCARHLETPRA